MVDILQHNPPKRDFRIVQPDGTIDYSKIKIDNSQTLEDAIVVTPLKKVNGNFANKDYVLQAINRGDLKEMRKISDFYYKTSGIYARLCRYLAYLYRYDWCVTPFINGGDTYPSGDEKADLETKDVRKVLDNFFGVLRYLDNFRAKKNFNNIALKVVRQGCYYGYITHFQKGPMIQELPVEYCRSRFEIEGRPAIELNMKYFDDYYPDDQYRQRILNLFPEEFKKGYRLFKKGKLKGDFSGDTAGWYLLDTKCAFKVNMNGDDFPVMIAVIPALIDLDEAQALDRKKMAQKLLKIIIQQMPFDKQGDPIFDNDEVQQLHNNAVKMLTRAIGIDVLTTYADVSVEDMADNSTTTSVDELEKVERAVFNEAGISQMQFNTDGNIALEKSILNDCAMMSNLILQFEDIMNMILINFNKSPKKVYYEASILPTTIYNYTELSKIYEGQMKLGYSKMLAQIALGESQSSILATAYFENDLLNLVTAFVPPLTSNTMNAEALAQQQTGRSGRGDLKSNSGNDSDGAGRPEKPDDEKSTKTLQNLESAN